MAYQYGKVTPWYVLCGHEREDVIAYINDLFLASLDVN